MAHTGLARHSTLSSMAASALRLCSTSTLLLAGVHAGILLGHHTVLCHPPHRRPTRSLAGAQAFIKNVTTGKLSKGDKLGQVDHAAVEYPPFRRNFYIEVPELARMSEAEVGELRKQLDNVKVPPPLRGWRRLSHMLVDGGSLALAVACAPALPVQLAATGFGGGSLVMDLESPGCQGSRTRLCWQWYATATFRASSPDAGCLVHRQGARMCQSL